MPLTLPRIESMGKKRQQVSPWIGRWLNGENT